MPQVKTKVRALIFCLFILLSGAITLYSECVQAANHFDLGAGHESPSIHCPDAFLISNIKLASTIQSHSRNLSNVLPSLHEKIDSVVSGAWFKVHPFREPFSQQDLFRLEEVYRL